MKDIMFLSREEKESINDTIDGLLVGTGLDFPKNTVMELCRKLGIQYTLGELEPNISGLIIYENMTGSLPKIVVNQNDAPVRQQFTLAHELGHFVLGHVKKGVLFRDTNFTFGEDEETRQETEANYFAGTLLVPIEKLKWALNMSQFNLEVVARFFGVSAAVINCRLREV
jgi:predicted transcriptional regulator